MQAGLKFVAHHAHLFRSPIVANCRDLFNRLLTCLYSKHKRVALYASDAAAAVLVQVSIGITTAPTPPDAKPIFNSFIRVLVSMMEGQQGLDADATGAGALPFSKLDSMRLGMRGCGIFAAPIATFMGQDKLKVSHCVVLNASKCLCPCVRGEPPAECLRELSLLLQFLECDDVVLAVNFCCSRRFCCA